MPKIKLKSIDIQDIKFFDLVYSIIDLRICKDVDELFIVDEYIPVVNQYMLISTPATLEKLKIYLQSNTDLRCIVLYLLEGIVIRQLTDLGLIEYFDNNQLSMISSANYHSDRSFANIDYFLSLVNNTYNNTQSLNHFDKIFVPRNKPYKFLFLNKRSKYHRQELIKLLNEKNLLEDALWTDLSSNIKLPPNQDDYYNGVLSTISIANTSHDISWPDRVLFPNLYIDTYFSVITETNFRVPYSYCTEKIYKCLLMGHPFVVVTNYKFYQHLKDRGYKTFDGLIDESFDLIEENAERLLAIANAIEKLCLSDLDDFLIKAKPICEHNRLNFLRECGMHSLNNYNTLSNFFKTL
jgi:hypothetical protein